jgi:hypothetical protein
MSRSGSVPVQKRPGGWGRRVGAALVRREFAIAGSTAWTGRWPRERRLRGSGRLRNAEGPARSGPAGAMISGRRHPNNA